ncbi:Uncharacterised protein [Segatella copri]|nr:Uncharacterised protein [Segatella copri]
MLLPYVIFCHFALSTFSQTDGSITPLLSLTIARQATDVASSLSPKPSPMN